jgi:hypothetical protein
MTESLADIDARIKEAQQKAIELQQQRETLRQEQIEKIRGDDLKTEAVTIHDKMKDIERNELEKYVENFPDRLNSLMNTKRLQYIGGLNPSQPMLTPAHEEQLLDNSIEMLERGQQGNVKYQTKDLQQEWNAVTQKVQEQQAEIEKIEADREQLKAQGLDKIAAMSVRRDRAELNNEAKAQQALEQTEQSQNERSAADYAAYFGNAIPNGGKDLTPEQTEKWAKLYDKLEGQRGERSDHMQEHDGAGLSEKAHERERER